ncbi:MAG: hypothetical protein IPH54_01710 [Rhodoferax sp.]|nr:hypothetical protein [Rhodoferax sp.]
MKFAVTVVSPPGYVHSAAFREIAESIHYGLLALGHDSVCTTEGCLSERRHIVLGSNLLPHFPLPIAADAILYNLEQIEPGSPWMPEEMLAIFRRHVVWDYSRRNAVALAELGIHVAHVLPIGYVPELTRIVRDSEPEMDVLFCGSLTERRKEAIIKMRETGLRVVAAVGLYGAQRDEMIGRAKVILNMHQHEAKILEMVRISYLLANRCTVLSEHSSDRIEDAALSSGVAFAEYSDLAQRARQLIDNPDECERLAQSGFKITSGWTMEKYLRDALLTLN